jgi:hypothetical protein
MKAKDTMLQQNLCTSFYFAILTSAPGLEKIHDASHHTLGPFASPNKVETIVAAVVIITGLTYLPQLELNID